MPTEAELEVELPNKAFFNMRLMRYIRTKWNVTKDDVLENDVAKKNSAYYVF